MLEWHARSRLIDLFRYKPSAVKVDDLRGQVTDKVLAQLMSKNASVASLIGATISVGSFPKYMAIIRRVFVDLSIPIGPYEWLKSDAEPGLPWVTASQFEELERLFEFRNTLVHEMNLNVVGHPNIRDSWSPDTALAAGELVLSTMRGIEAAFTQHGPRGLPNILAATGEPENPLPLLEQELRALEARVDQLAQTVEWGDVDRAQCDWQEAVRLAGQSYKADMHFVESAGFLHSRYIDLKTPLKLQLASARVAYLRALVGAAGSLWDDSEPAEVDPQIN